MWPVHSLMSPLAAGTVLWAMAVMWSFALVAQETRIDIRSDAIVYCAARTNASHLDKCAVIGLPPNVSAHDGQGAVALTRAIMRGAIKYAGKVMVALAAVQMEVFDRIVDTIELPTLLAISALTCGASVLHGIGLYRRWRPRAVA